MNFSLNDLVELSAWVYALIVAISAGDAMLPVLPSESIVILGGVLAARGDLSLVLVVITAAVGAFVGDNISYQIGSAANGKGKQPEDLKGKLGDALGWAEAALETRGTAMIVVARFIPGGRTAITFGSGYLSYSRLRFMVADAIAAGVWALYATFLGFFGGRVFEDRWWAALLLGFALSLVVAGLIELIRKLLGKGTDLSDKRDQIQAERSDDAETSSERTGGGD